jgi:hypothetical protein
MVKAIAAVVPVATENISMLLLRVILPSLLLWNAVLIHCINEWQRITQNNRSPAQEMPIRNMCLSINRLL